ncbi:MAG: FAD-dependent monooxygenase [Deltaproteobacteria bacterium]|nr:FAD-dependent monooxygenase [Deltaproteobacteria bacterium]
MAVKLSDGGGVGTATTEVRNMFGKKAPDVLVVGAGPVGLYSALVLARHKIPVTVVDKAWRPASRAYALALHGASLDLLEEVGLVGRVLEKARRVDTVGLYEGSDRKAEVRLTAGDRRAFVAVMSQDRLEGLLGEALEALGVPILWSHRISHMEEAGDRVHVAVDKLEKESMGYGVARFDWTIAKSYDWKVPFVLGADGYQSFVRRSLDIPFPEVGKAQHFAVFEFETDADLGPEMRLVLEAERTNVLWPLPGRRMRWSFELEEFSGDELSRQKDRLLVQVGGDEYPVLDPEHLYGFLKERAPWFKGAIDDIDWRLVVRFEKRLATSFGRGRTWLAGDAGHMTGPAGIQSMNVGLREGHDLAHAIANVLKGDAGMEKLTAYGEGRTEEWSRLLGLAGAVKPLPKVDPWIAARAGRLQGSLPATGATLRGLMEQLGLHVE